MKLNKINKIRYIINFKMIYNNKDISKNCKEKKKIKSKIKNTFSKLKNRFKKRKYYYINNLIFNILLA